MCRWLLWAPTDRFYLPPPSPSSTSSSSFTSCFEERPVLPPRSPVPPPSLTMRPSKHNLSASPGPGHPQARSSSSPSPWATRRTRLLRSRPETTLSSLSRAQALLLSPPTGTPAVLLPGGPAASSPPPSPHAPTLASGTPGSPPLLQFLLLLLPASNHVKFLAPRSSSASSYSSSSLLDPLVFREGRGLSLIDSSQSSAPAPLPDRPAFLERYGAANMAAVKPMVHQPGGVKPNSSYNNNNCRTAAPSMQQEQSITQVRERWSSCFVSARLRSRAECEELLQRCHWNLEESSTLMLDSYGPHRNIYQSSNID
ncbi:hypothetical protein L3Q82_004675 [Scortum barcoo]|uniref:Uncharacterized protein n=1 Tax=Scortum barcoo TaxID=214431 RepID=A0ACB8VJ04_9TELE|nr:hypothetical protein L3Q82_004675 [Scortum barcoo]